MKPLLYFAVCMVIVLAVVVASTYAKQSDKLTSNKNRSRADYRFYPVSYVIDGDTFISQSQKFRLWGIDAPERDEPYYQDSRLALQSLIGRNHSECKMMDVDRYNRPVMYCFIKGEDLGGLMVKQGYVRDYTRYSDGFYAEQETHARTRKAGLWE